MKKPVFMLFGIILMMSLANVSTASENRSMMDESMNSSDSEKGLMMDESADLSDFEKEPMMKDDSSDSGKRPAMDESMKPSDSSDWGVSPSARAQISGTAEGSTVSGWVDLTETGKGVQVVATLSNVSPAGKHGFHIHENGSCEDGGKAAGGHFNPGAADHGLLPRDGLDKAHAGDMGNIDIDHNGKGTLLVFLPGLSLTKGKYNVNGKAIIVHEKEDDFGQPTGNAGGRIGCGIISLNN